jgi:hypothetical protein
MAGGFFHFSGMRKLPAPRVLPLLGLLLCVLPLRAQPGACQAPSPVQHAIENSEHVPNCIPISFSHYPPTSGHHYDSWAKFQTFKFVVNTGYYLHSAEHGAVVLLINCQTAGNCEDDFVRLQRIADAVPADPLCDIATKHRIVITEDTLIHTRFAAIAWGWSLESNCLDSAGFAEFIKAHYAHGSENLCGGGTDFTGSGWCNAPLVGLLDGNIRAAVPAQAAGKSRILWAGSLNRRGRLWVEVSSLNGALLGHYDLGTAGPGPAQAAWNPSAFRKDFGVAGVVACRVGLETASGLRILAATVLAP